MLQRQVSQATVYAPEMNSRKRVRHHSLLSMRLPWTSLVLSQRLLPFSRCQKRFRLSILQRAIQPWILRLGNQMVGWRNERTICSESPSGELVSKTERSEIAVMLGAVQTPSIVLRGDQSGATEDLLRLLGTRWEFSIRER